VYFVTSVFQLLYCENKHCTLFSYSAKTNSVTVVVTEKNSYCVTAFTMHLAQSFTLLLEYDGNRRWNCNLRKIVSSIIQQPQLATTIYVTTILLYFSWQLL